MHRHKSHHQHGGRLVLQAGPVELHDDAVVRHLGLVTALQLLGSYRLDPPPKALVHLIKRAGA